MVIGSVKPFPARQRGVGADAALGPINHGPAA